MNYNMKRSARARTNKHRIEQQQQPSCFAFTPTFCTLNAGENAFFKTWIGQEEGSRKTAAAAFSLLGKEENLERGRRHYKKIAKHDNIRLTGDYYLLDKY